jgi:hypothetical protein
MGAQIDASLTNYLILKSPHRIVSLIGVWFREFSPELATKTASSLAGSVLLAFFTRKASDNDGIDDEGTSTANTQPHPAVAIDEFSRDRRPNHIRIHREHCIG